MSATTHAENRLRVLLVDDNHETRAMYARPLAANGFSAIHVRAPEEGLAPAREAQPEAIVTALRFPGPMDGLTLTRRLRLDPATSRVKVVVLTGHAYDTDREAAKRVGCDLFLTKPCDPAALIEALHTVGSFAPRPSTHVPTQGLSALLWSRRGEVACATHAPSPDSERWGAERWKPVPMDIAEGRVRYQCQHCAGRPIDHRTAGRTASPRATDPFTCE